MLLDRGITLAPSRTALAAALFICFAAATVAFGDPVDLPSGPDAASVPGAEPDSAAAWADTTGGGPPPADSAAAWVDTTGGAPFSAIGPPAPADASP